LKIPIFELERIQSMYENTVEFNLTESGFHPLSLAELLTRPQLEELLHLPLGYGQTNGSPRLRERIAELHGRPGAVDEVLVTNGSSEANFIACRTLVEAGDEVVVMLPNYMQIWGIVEELDAVPRAFHLREDEGWRPDLDELEGVLSSKTTMIAVCNPNNPTGATLREDEIDRIVELADTVGAWVYADEVYRGAELDGNERPSFAGRGERVIVNGGLSKAYALPGLRLGWLVGPADVIADFWAYHDYTSITAGIISNRVAEIALSPEVRPTILQRNRSMLRHNLELTERWLDRWPEVFSWTPPSAGSMVFSRYRLEANSSELVHWLRTEKDVFVVAGDCFRMDGFIRIGIGAEADYLAAGLARVAEGLAERYGL
jgi:hypothetical protein